MAVSIHIPIFILTAMPEPIMAVPMHLMTMSCSRIYVGEMRSVTVNIVSNMRPNAPKISTLSHSDNRLIYVWHDHG